jgi:hypothetical protein
MNNIYGDAGDSVLTGLLFFIAHSRTTDPAGRDVGGSGLVDSGRKPVERMECLKSNHHISGSIELKSPVPPDSGAGSLEPGFAGDPPSPDHELRRTGHE